MVALLAEALSVGGHIRRQSYEAEEGRVEGEAKDGAYVCGRIGRPRIPGSASPRIFPSPWRPAGTRGWGTQLCTGHARMSENWESEAHAPPRVIRPRCTSHLRLDSLRRMRASVGRYIPSARVDAERIRHSPGVRSLSKPNLRKGASAANAGKQTLPLPRNHHGDATLRVYLMVSLPRPDNYFNCSLPTFCLQQKKK